MSTEVELRGPRVFHYCDPENYMLHITDYYRGIGEPDFGECEPGDWKDVKTELEELRSEHFSRARRLP